MADNYRSEICSTGGRGSWWNPKRSSSSSGGGGGGTRIEDTTAVSCSTAITDLHSSASDIASSISDSTLQLPLFGLSASPIDWSQTLLRGSEKAVPNLNQMSYFRNDQQTLDSNQVHGATEESGMNPFNQSFILDQSRVSSCPDLTREGVETNYDGSLGPVSYNYSSSMVQGLLETNTKTQQSIYNERSNTTSYSQLLQPFPHEFLHSPSSKQNQSNQLQLSNDTPFWNASIPSQFVAQIHESKSSSSNLIERLSRDHGAQESCSSVCNKSDYETGFKKPRIETPSPLPTFKVRKEKLGDRITALQQLVSPFGKTDTASVLHEAIEYIKFLHDQVAVLSTPYLKNDNPIQQQQQVSGISNESKGPKKDLRNRGLCLVPIANTYPVASETTTDFWHPTFGGTFR
ncbi:transcription factor bHLH112-like [Carex rostrata]